MRTFDVDKVRAATAQYATDIVGFDPEEWLSNEDNIALINENDDIALFENQGRLFNAVCGHYFFFSRGKEAIRAAEEFLNEAFTTTYIERIVGLTPLDNKGALWMNRRLGFKEYSTIRTEIGECKFVMMTKDEWKAKVQ